MGGKMTIKQVLEETIRIMGGINVPVMLKEQIADPLANAIANLALCVNAIDAADAKREQGNRAGNRGRNGGNGGDRNDGDSPFVPDEPERQGPSPCSEAVVEEIGGNG